MLARGQVVPFSMTLELLKDVVNLTCSETLIVENCPMYVDHIEYIGKEFRIDRVFYIDGTDKARAVWKDAYTAENKDGAKAFDERMDRLTPIVSHFARLGKLERLEVNDTPKEKKLSEEIKKATVPQFAIVTGLSDALTLKQADMLAESYGVGPAITPAFLKQWAAQKFPSRSVDVDSPREVFSAMKKYADATNFSLLVLSRYPNRQEDAAAFIEEFGVPKVVASINQDEEQLLEEFNAAHADDENPPGEEEAAEILKTNRELMEGTFGLFKEKCPSVTMSTQWVLESSNHEDLCASIKQRLRPQVYAIVAPQGMCDFSNSVADAVCVSRREGQRPQKYTVVDCNELVKPESKHSPEIADRLRKAAFVSDAPDRLPVNLWIDLLKEAFASSANPMGTFLVTNFPTQCSVAASPTVSDQFYMLGESANLMGMAFVKLSEAAYKKFCSDDPAAWEAYQAFDEQVNTQGKVQFERHQVCECFVEQAENLAAVVTSVADEFRSFQDRAEKGAQP
jgi:hypothetical protein